MTAANWLTLAASLVALLSVILSYLASRRQIRNANELALKQIEAATQQSARQIEAASKETARKLKAEVVLKQRQEWIKEFRETINDLLYIGDPYLDATVAMKERVQQMTRLAHKVDLMLPVGESHGQLMGAIVVFAEMMKDNSSESLVKQRLEYASKITAAARAILRDETTSVEFSL